MMKKLDYIIINFSLKKSFKFSCRTNTVQTKNKTPL